MNNNKRAYETEYEAYAASSPTRLFGLRRERLLLKVTQALWEALASTGMNQAALARKLGKSESFVSQVLSGGRNLTLRTVADVTTALECEINVAVRKSVACHTILQFPMMWQAQGDFSVESSEPLEMEGAA